MLSTQNVWFPLRSNIAYFETKRTQLSLEARVKEMALLADDLWFEAGMITVDVAKHFVLGPWWYPPDGITEEQIVELRTLTKRGSPFSFAIGVQPAPGVPAPAEAMRTLGGGPRQHGFVAEYHLLLRNSRLLDQPWIHVGLLEEEAEPQAQAIAAAEDSWDFAMSHSAPRLSRNALLDGVLKKSLNRDLAVSSLVGMPAVVDRLRGRMLRFKVRKGIQKVGELGGARALTLWVPDFSTRPWRDIIALHDHDAIGAFRAKLIEAEENVAGLRGRARDDALRDIGMDQVTAALRKRFPSIKRRALDIAIEAVAGLTLGRLATVTTTIKHVAERQRAATEWTAVYLELTKK